MRTKKDEENFIKDLFGYCCYCVGRNIPDTKIQFNIFHDLSEWFKNRNEKWFSPRTTGYRKHIPESLQQKSEVKNA